jgi:hypothetical protein
LPSSSRPLRRAVDEDEDAVVAEDGVDPSLEREAEPRRRCEDAAGPAEDWFDPASAFAPIEPGTGTRGIDGTELVPSAPAEGGA